MSNILTRKEAPFILALFIAAFSWAVTHIVTRTIEKPTIEFSPQTLASIPNDILTCSGESLDSQAQLETISFLLTNISKNQLFEDLSFLVIAQEGKIHGVRLRAHSPAVSGNTPEKCSTEHGEFNDITLHPGWRLSLDIVADRHANLAIRLNSAKKAVNLIECNLETWLVRHESSIITWFLIFISAVSVGYIIYIARNPN